MSTEEVDQIQGDQLQGDQLQGDQLQGDQIQGDQIQGDQLQGDQIQGDQISPEEQNVLVKDNDLFEISSFYQSKYFWTFVLLFIAGVFYGMTYAFKNMQIKFPLYCACVWLVCLALICLANYRSDQTASGPSSSSSA